VLSRSSDLRLPRRVGRRLRLPARGATPVLVVSALMCGLAVGSAVFASLWTNETADRQAAQQALGQEHARTRQLAAEIDSLRARLRATRHTAAAAAKTAADRKSLIASLDRSAGSLLSASTPLQDQAAAITDRSQSLSSLIRTLDNDLAGLSHYVSGADASNLDPAFLQAQLDYLKPSLSKVGAAADGLAAQANDYSDAVRAFVGSAAAYAATAKEATKR
jgi:chromosome segregation ATPase